MSVLLFFVPSLDPVNLLLDAVVLGINLSACLALFCHRVCVHRQLHAAGFASAVLLGAMLAEVSPLVVAAHHLVLVVKAHTGDSGFSHFSQVSLRVKVETLLMTLV